MADLKPTTFLKETIIKEAVRSPEIKPGVTIVYNGANYTVIKMMDNSLGWIMYSDRPDKKFHHAPGGVEIPFDSELYSRPAFLPSKSSMALVTEILKKIKEAQSKNIKKGSSIPAEAGPHEIMQYVRDGKLNYEDATQLMLPYNPRWLVTLARHFHQPSYKIQDLLIKQKESALLADYAIRAVKKRLSPEAENIIKLVPQAWQMYTTNLPR